MAIYGFEGTSLTRADQSNVFLLEDAHCSRHHCYIEGIGSGGANKRIEQATGLGGKVRVGRALSAWKYWNSSDRDNGNAARVNIVVAYSRGVVLALEFINQVHDLGGSIDFFVAFDCVGSFGNPFNKRDIGYRKSIPSSVVRAAHAISIDETRFTFRSIDFGLADGNTTTAFEKCRFPGVHSDIGNTGKPGLGAAARDWAFSESFKQPKALQWDLRSIESARDRVNCQEAPSKNNFSIPGGWFKKLRTRKPAPGDRICCQSAA